MSLLEVYQYWFLLEWFINCAAVTTQLKERVSCTSTNSGSFIYRMQLQASTVSPVMREAET